MKSLLKFLIIIYSIQKNNSIYSSENADPLLKILQDKYTPNESVDLEEEKKEKEKLLKIQINKKKIAIEQKKKEDMINQQKIKFIKDMFREIGYGLKIQTIQWIIKNKKKIFTIIFLNLFIAGLFTFYFRYKYSYQLKQLKDNE